MTTTSELGGDQEAHSLEPTSRRSALKLGLTGAGLAAGGAALAGVLSAAPAGASGAHEVRLLQLTWNGQSVTTTAILPAGYDTSVGGIISGVMAFDGNTLTCPLIQVDGSSNVVRMVTLVDIYNAVWIACVDGEGNKVPWGFIGLTQEIAGGNPGDTNPDGVASNLGMITPDGDGSLWVCIKDAPGATWAHHPVPYGDTGGGAPTGDGSYVGQLATDGAAGTLYMWNGSSWLSTTLS
jgi:hypothetical protein